jgi:hypothetical protein
MNRKRCFFRWQILGRTFEVMDCSADGFSPPFLVPGPPFITTPGNNEECLMKSVAWTAWYCLILSLLFLADAGAQDSPPNLTGTWILNEKENDDFVAVMRRATGERQGGRESGMGMGRGGGRGNGGRGGGGPSGSGLSGSSGKGVTGSRGAEEHQVRAQQKLARLQEEDSRLEIFHDGL